MPIFSDRGVKSLRRTANASDIPAIDRAVAIASAELLIAKDREMIAETFVSRSVFACAGAWVWPEQVLLGMAKEVEHRRKADENTAVGSEVSNLRKPKLVQLPLNGSRGRHIPAAALVAPERILEVSGDTFRTFTLNSLDRLSVARSTLAWLNEAPDPALELNFLRNARFLGEALGLPLAGVRLLELMALVHFNDRFKSLLSSVDVVSMSCAVFTIAKWVNTDHSTIKTMLSPAGVLVKSGVHDGFERSADEMDDALRIDNVSLTTRLQEHHPDSESFANSFLQAAQASHLRVDDVPHLASFHPMAQAVMKEGALQKALGINVMLYGPPGTGKTEYAKLLAQESGLKLYEVPYAWHTGESLNPRQRLGSCLISLIALKHRRNVALLVDEADEIFDLLADNPLGRDRGMSKAWMNNFLETVAVPIVWTSNDITCIDPANLRRFSMVKELGSAPRKVRESITRKILAPLNLSNQTLRSIASMPHLTPGNLETTARAMALARPQDAEQATLWVRQHIDDAQHAQRLPKLNPNSETAFRFDPRFVNMQGPLSTDRLVQHLKQSPRLSLCFHGVPGSGKTGFAQYLAEVLERELVVKTASSLLSKYVGDTEKNICAMFDDAALQSANAILLLDEADTFLRNREKATTLWEISHTNEFLARMASFPGTFVCTTNLMGELDSAVLRRFQFKLRFDPMRSDQLTTMFSEVFGLPAPEQLQSIRDVVPADLVNIKRQLEVLDHTPLPSILLEMLQQEVTGRQGLSGRQAGIGFLHNFIPVNGAEMAFGKSLATME